MSDSPRSTTRRNAILAATVIAFSLPGIASSAQNYPSKPITLVVPFSAGAGTDQVARAVAEKLGGMMGATVLVENRPGAAGVIGATYVAKAVADGHTLLFTPNSFSFAQLISGGGKPAYSPIDSFKPVIEVCKTPVFLVAGPQPGVKTFQEALTTSKKTTLTYGSAGSGSITHLIGEAVNQATGINLEHVPYKGTSQAVVDLLGGHVAYSYASMSTIEPHLKTQKMRILATTGNTRTELAPDVPTIAELGYPKVNIMSWYGIFAPQGTSDSIISLLNGHIDKILKMPDVIETLKKQGSTPVGGPASALNQTNRADAAVYQKLIKELNITAN